MSDQELWQLLDHPPADADAPRNPVLTTHVMDRVRDEHRTARIASKPLSPLPWIIVAVMVLVGVAVIPVTGVADDGALDGAFALFDPESLLEVVIGSIIALVALAWSWRRLA